MWRPQEGPQTHAILATFIDELFYGGARGGGKSDFLLGDFLQDVETYKGHWRGILFRKTYDELEELQNRAEKLFPQTGAEYRAGKRTWFWPNGAFLKMRYMEQEKDYNRYHGHQYTWVGFDELTSWPNDKAYRAISSCLRNAEIPVPTKRRRASGNPGGVGHSWVKRRFIKPARLGYRRIFDAETNTHRMFIPAKVTDNKILMENDPNYIHRLKGSGTAALVKAWLDGDWDIAVGAFFTNFGERNIVMPFDIPSSWPRYRSFDWGFSSPFSVGWWALANGEQPRNCDRLIRRGALVRYREWYGATESGDGLKMKNEDIAREIVMRSNQEKFAISVADPSIWAAKGGESIAETFARNGVIWQPGDNQRVPGWQQLYQRIEGDEEGPMLLSFDSCQHFNSSIPELPHDDDNPEDIDTEAEDHVGDEARYMCMARPWSKAHKPTTVVHGDTFNSLLKHNRAKRLQRAA